MKRRVVVAAMSALTIAFPTAIASAAPDPTTQVELGVEQDQFVAEKVTFDPSVGRTEGLAALKELRGYMWDQNPPFKGYGFEGYTGTLRDAAAKEGITTKAQFQNITADEDANWMAIQRAVEVSEVWGHTRPDGTDVGTATRGAKNPGLESLGAGHGNLRTAIVDGLGKDELPILIQLDGKWGKVGNKHSGHLIHLIHPRHKHWGFGHVYSSNSEYRNYYAAINVDSTSGPDMTAGPSQTTTVYRAPKPGETPTGIIDPGESTDPVNPVDPTNPNDPSNPADPANPNDPGNDDSNGSSLDGSTIGMIVGILALILAVIGGISFSLPIHL